MNDPLHILRNLRISPIIQQGGTQTIQQSIYLSHDNPCGANLLIFQEMGLTQIRYIDLKNYLDEILGSELMKELFEQVRIVGTAYINTPDNPQLLYHYLYTIQNWADAAISFLPIPVTYYPGYRIRFSVYDASGSSIYDSNFSYLPIIREINGVYYRIQVKVVSNPHGETYVPLYKLDLNYLYMPYLDTSNIYSLVATYSDFVVNQMPLPETTMCISSLLVDSANTRTFGIPKYGFSARSNVHGIGFGGIGYHCVQFIDIRTIPDENEQTTLIESIFARLSIEEDTLFIGSPNLNNTNHLKTDVNLNINNKNIIDSKLEKNKDLSAYALEKDDILKSHTN